MTVDTTDLIRETPRSWIVRWRDVSHDESLAWFQASRRPSGAPLDGEEVISAGAYDALAAALGRAEQERDEANVSWLKAKNEASHHLRRYQELKGVADFAEAERDRLRGALERADERVTTLEERLRHDAAESKVTP